MRKQALQGSISIFLILVLVPLLSGTYLAIDAGRTAAARARLESALDLTGNAALNDYDQALKDRYGLFAMPGKTEAREAALAAVFSETIDAGEITAGDTSAIGQYVSGFFGSLLSDGGQVSYDNYINTTTKTFSLKYPAESSLARPAVLERTLTDYMKYRGPYRFARGVGQRLGAFQHVKAASDAMEKSRKYYDSLSGVSKQLEKLGNALPASADGAGEEGFDADAQSKAVDSLLNGLDKLSSTVGKSQKAAGEWKSALEEMPEGEAKALLSGDYKNTAEILSRDGVERLRDSLQQDKSAIEDYRKAREQAAADRKKAEEALKAAEETVAAGGEMPAGLIDPASITDPDPPDLSYTKDSLYGYIRNSRSSHTADPDAAEKKTALESLSNADRSVLISGVPDVFVSQTVGSAIASAIDAVGSTDAQSPNGNVGSFFSALAGGTDSLMADSYTEEFMTESFSCYTTDEKAKTLAGAAMSDSPFYRGEVEYILFGQDSLPANVHLAAELLFLVRTLFNSIYAYSNAKMRAEALTLAASISAWTGVGVVVVQNLILGAWAMAESVSDVSTLLKGGSVPLYKNAATWTLGTSGIANKLKEGAANLASQTIDDVYARIEKAADDKLEEISDAALSYLRETSEGAVESLTNAIVTPVESKLSTMIGGRTEALEHYSRDDIRSMLLEAVNGADNGSAGFKAARTAFANAALEPLTGVVYDNYKGLLSLDEEVSQTAARAIENGIRDAYDTLFREVKKAVDKKVSGAEKTLHNALKEGGSEVKADVLEAIDDYAETLSGYLGSENAGKRAAANSSLSSYSGTAMSYKDYLKVFAFAGIVRNSVKQGMLTRSAKLIQGNCRQMESGFRVQKSYRSVIIKGSARIVTHTVKGEERYAY